MSKVDLFVIAIVGGIRREDDQAAVDREGLLPMMARLMLGTAEGEKARH